MRFTRYNKARTPNCSPYRLHWEIRSDVYTLPCVTQIASGDLLYSAGSSLALCDLQEWERGGGSWGGRLNREGIHVYL